MQRCRQRKHSNWVDRRKAAAISHLGKPMPKRQFLFRRAIDSLRRRPSQNEKSSKLAGVGNHRKQHRLPRTHARTQCQALALLESSDSRERSPATVFNYSPAGFYIETDASPSPDSGVILHIENYRASAPRPENVPRYFCQVRWSRPLSGQEAQRRFAVGLKICASLDEFTRLFSL